MAQKMFVRQSMVNAADLNYEQMSCPECGNSGSLILSGYTMIPREDVYEDGRLVSRDQRIEQSAFDLRQIFCLACQNKALVQDPQNFALQKTNLLLNNKIRELTDSKEDPLSFGAVN